MGKFYKILLLSCFFALTSFNLYSQQINLIRFNNSASYTPGSGVSVIINPTGVFQLDNQFILELSNPGGTFTTPTVLNTLNEFYVPAINGVLPNSLAAGTYKLRVRSTQPAVTVDSNSFTVVSGSGISVPKATSSILNNSNFFNCINCNNDFTIFGSLNRSDIATVNNSINPAGLRDLTICNYDDNYTYTIKLISKIDVPTASISSPININHTNGIFTLPSTLSIGTHIFEIEKRNSTSISVFSTIFLFHGNATNLGNSSSEQICVNDTVTFSIDRTITGIGRNYYGSKYRIDFGDNTINEYTHAQLIDLLNNNDLSHVYRTVSCNQPNSFYVIKKELFNEGIFNSCDNYVLNGNGVTKNVNTSSAPIANIILPEKQCITNNIFVDNTTTPGAFGNNGACLSEVVYYWSYKKPGDTNFTNIPQNSSWINSSFDLTIPSSFVTIPGCWEVKLEAINPDLCQNVSEVIKTIIIEATPIPTFTNTPQSPICAGTSILFTNTSNVLNLPCQEPTYSWTVTPVAGTPATSSGYQFVAPTDASSQNANILFTQPGSYSVVLNVTNSCGTFASTPRIIEVFGNPTVSFNPNTLTICDTAPAGYTIDFSLASTKPIYSAAPYAPTSYNWTVSGSGVTAADYSFVGGTNANSQYPQINFTAYKTYIITVQVNGNCSGSNQASFTFTLKQTPIITNTNLSQSICTGGTTTPINLTSDMPSGTVYNWTVTATNGITGFTTPGTGNTIPGANLVNPTNTTGTVTYTVTPSNNGCTGSPVNFVITVNSAPSIPNQALTVCSGNAFTVSLTNNPPSTILPIGTTFTWTVSSPAGISGASNQTTPVSTIGQTLVNTTNAPIDVIYTITASTGSAPSICTSNFTLTVTVNPRPQIPNQTLSVCSGNAFNLSLSNNPPSIILPSGTTYNWTVTAPAGITGASNQNTPISNIGQTLLNSTSNPINVVYNITATSGSGSSACTNNFTLTVTVNPAPSASISGNATVCQNANPAVITFTGVNGVAPYTFTYSINGGANQTISTSSGNSVSINAPTSALGTFNYCLLNVVDSSSSSCLNTSNSCVTVIVNPLPTISTQPTNTQSICVGGTIAPLSVAYTGGVGTATYQWYSNTTNSNSGGTLIAGATNATFTPAAFTNAGTYYFYATITLSGNGCGSTTSNTAEVIVVADPMVDTQALATQTLCQNSTPTDLTITVSGGIGTFAYQWYSNTTNSTTGGTLIPGATNATFTPPTATVGTQYYYCVVTQSGVGCNVTSAVSTVIIVPAPTITTQPASSSVCENGTPTTLSVAYTNGTGTPSYQWFSNTTNSNIGGTPIPSANAASYNPPATTVGTLYYYCEITFSSGGCTSVLSNTAEVVINPLPTISTQPTNTQSICVGGTIAPLSVAYTGGVGTATYQWYSNTTNSNSGGTLIAGATNATFTPAAFTNAGTYYFYATITLSGNGCGSTTSNTAEVIVVADPMVDTQALATQTLCQNSTPTDLTITVSGGIGTFAYQWYSNTTNSTTGGTLIPGATNATFTPPTATVGTQYYYCVVTQSGVGCNVTSAVSTVIIVPAPTITTQPASSSVCENGTPTTLSVAYTNGTGTPSYQWFSNTTNSNIGGTPIPSANAVSYNPPATTVGTLYYYCEITFSSGGCTSVLSNTAEVVINPLPTISTQPTNTQSICVGGTIAPLSVAYTGGVGTATYQWYSNTTNSNSGGTLIAGATNATFTPAAFTNAGTYYFYATITLSGNGCGSTTSNTAEVIVVADPMVDTQALATQTLCQNSTPTDLTITVSGGIGTFAYQWYSNTTNSTTGGTLIPGATNATFTPPTATVNTRYYYCVVTQSGLGCNVTSAVSTVIIVPAPTITTQPASSSVCENGTPTTLSVAYTNGTGTPSYQWFSNTTNSNIGGTPIPSANAASYNPPATTVGTLYYYCEITFSSGGCTSVLSNTAEVVINPLPTISTQPTNTQSICVGGTIDPLTVAYTGGVGTATYQWYSNATNANSGGTLIAGATNSSYTPAAFTTAGTYYFYATITLSGNGCGSTTSNTAEVIVVADPMVDTQALATQTLCQNSTPTDLTITVSGGIGTFAYQWYSNTTNSTTGGTLIPGATNATFTPPTATVNTRYYYCVVTQSGLGCNVTSAVSTVIIVPAPTITTQPASSSVCENGTPTTLSVAYTNGTGTPSYQWFSNTTNSNIGGTPIPSANAASYNPPATTVGTLYYYCEITFSSGGCTSVLSNTAEVVINPLPTISTQPTNTQSICVGGTIAPLSVAYTGGVGTATYQWYSNTTNSNSGGTLIAGATNATFTPAAFTNAGTYYFYATITLSGNGCGSTTSNTAEVIVVADPMVDTQALATQTLCQNSTPTDLTITVSGGIGTFAYQWYSNTTNSTTGGTLIPGATNATFTPPTATVNTRYYYCVVTQSGLGCNVTSAVSTVIIVPAPTITTQPASSSVCENGTPTTLSVAYTNGTGTPSYQWFSNTTNSNIGGTPIPSANAASYNPPATTVGTLYYYCEITFSSGGCTSVLSNTAEVVINPLPTISTQPTNTQSICVGGTIAPLSVAYTGGVGTATYQWYSNTTNSNSGGTLIAGATNATFTPAAFTNAGTYYFYATITLSGNGCGSTTSNTAEVIVVADPMVDTQALATQTLCQNSTPTDLTITVSGGIGTFAYQWYSNTTNSTTGGTLIPGATNATFTPPTATVNTRYYYCVVTQSGLGCNVTSAVSTVIIVPAPTITTQPASSSVCENGTPTTLSVAYTNGTGTPSYQWFSNTTNSNIGGTPIPSANAASYNPPATTVGTLYYYCEITFSSGGCTSVLSNTAEVVINQIPVINNLTAIVCSGDQYIFNSTNSNDILPAGLQYSWNLISMTPAGSVSGSVNNETLQNQFIQQLINNSNGITTLIYEVTPVAGICTGNPFTITIEVYPKPDVVFDIPVQTICNDTETALVTLTSSLPGNITFEWNANIPAEITGAISAGTNTIPVQQLVNTTSTPLTITYSATATFNNNGSSCQGNIFTYTITVNPTFSSTGVLSNYNGYNVSVFGASDGAIDLTTTGGSGTYTYSWTGPNGFTASTEDLTNLFAGVYTVTVNDGYCAPLVLTFTLTQPPELLIQADPSLTVNLICFGDSNGAVGVLITQESVPPYDYQLFNSNGTLVASIIDTTNLNPQFNGLTAGVYNLIVTDANGGQKTVTGLTVTQPDDIVITAATTPITCYGANDASITLTVTGGTGPYQAQWDNLATGLYQNNLAAADYNILITDSNGCTKTIVVSIPEAPIFTINPVVVNISCYGANDGSVNLNLVGGIQPIYLTWSDGSTAGLVRNNLPPGTYTVTIVDSKPCTITRTFIIVEPQPLVLSANVQNALDCNDANSGAINLLVSGGTPPFTYSWTNGTTSEDLTNIPAGNYAVVVTDSRGCTKSAQYSVNRPQPLTLNVTSEIDVNCENREIRQVFEAQVSGGVPPIQLSWSSGTVSGANNEFITTNQDGLVLLTATDAIGCTTTYSFNVDLPILGDANFNQSSYGYTTYGLYSIFDPIQFTNTATGEYVSISWNFGDGTFSTEENPIHTYVNEGNYVVTQTVTYPYGCVYVHTISLIVEKGYVLVLPTGFTPNSDSLNDTYRPVTKALSSVKLEIFDTWGSLIFSEIGDTLRGWDGKINGIPAENGNYNAKVTAETFYGRTIYASETFVLIK